MPAIRAVALRLILIEDPDIRVAGEVASEGMRVDRAEVFGEPQLLIGRELLVSKEEHEVPIERGTQGREIFLGESAPQIESAYFRANCWGRWFEIESQSKAPLGRTHRPDRSMVPSGAFSRYPWQGLNSRRA